MSDEELLAMPAMPAMPIAGGATRRLRERPPAAGDAARTREMTHAR